MRDDQGKRAPVLSARDLHVYYDKVHAVQGISLDVHAGEVVAILGANGAGKSSAMRALMGLVPVRSGSVLLEGTSIDALRSDQRVARGLGYSPEGRRVFGDLTVHENLQMGAYVVNDRDEVSARVETVYGMFPRLRERTRQLAATLSGGEQQMLAIGRAMMRRPKVLMLDEPSLGLAPVMVKVIYQTLQRIREQGLTLLLSEQSAHIALAVADRAYVFENGRVAFSAPAQDLRNDPALRASYLGA
ncbi:ABC transporter ATP-binding protein [Ramlibacter sp. AN1133]|uniref:ABC transporter ATP-binding protein n=1 Tax=Ramlibacter sp. AN1133 TaxID=3133429 RepID=UPI0030C1EBAC